MEGRCREPGLEAACTRTGAKPIRPDLPAVDRVGREAMITAEAAGRCRDVLEQRTGLPCPRAHLTHGERLALTDLTSARHRTSLAGGEAFL